MKGYEGRQESKLGRGLTHHRERLRQVEISGVEAVPWKNGGVGGDLSRSALVFQDSPEESQEAALTSEGFRACRRRSTVAAGLELGRRRRRSGRSAGGNSYAAEDRTQMQPN